MRVCDEAAWWVGGGRERLAASVMGAIVMAKVCLVNAGIQALEQKNQKLC